MKLFKVSRRDNLDRHYLLKVAGFGIFAHRVHHNEHTDTFHNHPWDGFSIIFGQYVEEFLDGSQHLRRWFNTIKAPVFHRVTIKRPVWTLFFHGRRYNRWQVVDGGGRVISEEPWRGIGGRTSYRPI